MSGEGFLIPDYGLDIIAFIGIKDEKDIEYEEVFPNQNVLNCENQQIKSNLHFRSLSK